MATIEVNEDSVRLRDGIGNLAMETNVMEITLTPQMLTIIPMLAVAMQMLKGIEPLAKIKPWFPFLTIGISIGLAILMKMGPDLQAQTMAGVVMGLATSGGYDAAKLPTKVIESKTEPATADRAEP